jgi:hypothetical protein
MAISQAMWVHGHALQPENPALTVGRMGGAGQLRRAGSGWFHIAVPTPVIVTDIRLRAAAAIVFFSSGNQGAIHNLHVWDGNTRISANDNLNLSGANQFSRFNLPNPAVNFGIGISIFATLGTDAASAWIDIYSAGVDFV